MLDFRSIFDQHFFSNHHLHAKQTEEILETVFTGCECVTFSSFEALLITVADEMCDASRHLLDTALSSETEIAMTALNHFLSATSRPAVTLLSDAEKKVWLSQSQSCLGGCDGLSMDAVLVSGTDILAGILNFSGIHPMLASTGVFVTKNADLGEKIRWSRSSYGRRASAKVGIAANGRFSEFQAILMNHIVEHDLNGSHR